MKTFKISILTGGALVESVALQLASIGLMTICRDERVEFEIQLTPEDGDTDGDRLDAYFKARDILSQVFGRDHGFDPQVGR